MKQQIFGVRNYAFFTLIIILSFLFLNCPQEHLLEELIEKYFDDDLGNDNGQLMNFSGTNQYALPFKDNSFIDEVLDEADELGLTVIRTWGFNDGSYEGFQPHPAYYRGRAWERMDYIIQEAERKGIKLIIPFVNNWDAYGGMNQYVEWSQTIVGDGTHDDFFTDVGCKSLYKRYVEHMLNRVNSYTGVKYKDDPTILIWELANEPRCEDNEALRTWIEEMSAYIKSIDSEHLLSTGSEGAIDIGFENFLSNHSFDTIDVVSFHLYPDHWELSEDECLEYIEDHISLVTNGLNKKVYLGEFAYSVDRAGDPDFSERNRVYRDWYDKCDELNIFGAMFWILSPDSYPDYDAFTVYYPCDNGTCEVIYEYSQTVKMKNLLSQL